MGSYWSINFGSTEYNLGPEGYIPEITCLLLKKDLISDSSEPIYKIAKIDFVLRLESIGFSKKNIDIELVQYKKRLLLKKDSILLMDNSYKYISLPDDFWTEFQDLDYDEITRILSSEEDDAIQSYPIMLLQNEGQNFVIDPYFDQLNLYYIIAKEILNDDEYITIDLSQMVDLELWSTFDFEGDHLDEQLHIKNEKSLIYNDKYVFEENFAIELKGVQNSIINSIKKNLKKYIIGFLNSSVKGHLIFGIENDLTITGFKADTKKRDEIKQIIYSILSSIDPVVPLNWITINFITLIKNGRFIEDMYCLEVEIIERNTDEMYFSESGKTWIKLDAVLKELKGHELYCYIRDFNKQI